MTLVFVHDNMRNAFQILEEKITLADMYPTSVVFLNDLLLVVRLTCKIKPTQSPGLNLVRKTLNRGHN